MTRSMEELLEDHKAWLDQRARLLSDLFDEDADDCRQSLVLYLLKYKSQMTAWLRTFKDLTLQSKHNRTIKLSELPDFDLHELCVCDTGQRDFDLHEAISERLSEREQVVVLMWANKCPIKQIAKVMGCTPRRVHAVKAGAICKLRKED